MGSRRKSRSGRDKLPGILPQNWHHEADEIVSIRASIGPNPKRTLKAPIGVLYSRAREGLQNFVSRNWRVTHLSLCSCQRGQTVNVNRFDSSLYNGPYKCLPGTK